MMQLQRFPQLLKILSQKVVLTSPPNFILYGWMVLANPWYHFYERGVLNNEFPEGDHSDPLGKICSKNTFVGRGLIENRIKNTHILSFTPLRISKYLQTIQKYDFKNNEKKSENKTASP